jgi:hypothetical protein
MNPIGRSHLFRLAALATLSVAHAEVIVGWETTGQSNWGTQGLAPSFANPDLTVGGLTRGEGVTTPSTGVVANSWGGRGWNETSAEDAILDDDTITFSMTPAPGTQLTIQSLVFNYRVSRNSEGIQTGPNTAMIYYKIGGGDFIEMEAVGLNNSSTTGATATVEIEGNYFDLEGITGETLTFRIVPFVAPLPEPQPPPLSGGSLVFYGPMPGTDITVNGVVGTGGIDDNPPLVVGLSPADNASDVPAATNSLTMIFNENIARGTGNIIVTNALTAQPVAILNSANPAHVSVSGNQVGLLIGSVLAAGTPYYVEIPAGAIIDQASPANSFGGYSGSTAWNFTTASEIVPPRIVVNKVLNGNPDRVELLVVGNGSAGGSVDLRGMILKDFSNDMNSDAGGRLVFTNAPLWASVPVGTLLTLSNRSASPDLSTADFTLAVGLGDPIHFTPAGSQPFDITGTDMVMIKDAGSDPAGISGGIHALATGAASPSSFFTSFNGAKIRATSTADTNTGARVNNSGSSLSDYTSGTDATAGLTISLAEFGAPNSGSNAAYIAALRGRSSGDGDGAATVVNATLSSPFLGLPIFDDGQNGQSVKITLNALMPGITLSDIVLAVPASLGAPAGVVLAGAGSVGAGALVSGQTVTISGASVTAADPIEITLSGLSTPVPTLVSDDGNQLLTISTAAVGGSPIPISGAPAVRVIIPISSLRDVDAEGIALDSGAQVAIEGIATESDFGGGAANFSSYLQDTGAGVNVFSPSINLGILRGNRYVVTGLITQTSGLTSIVPQTGSSIVNRGAVPEVEAETVTLPTLLANPEAYEGKLVTVRNLAIESGSWGAGATVTLRDGSANLIDARIQPGSTATTAPGFPLDVTGVLGQVDGSSPFSTGYQLQPRDSDDLEPASSDFSDWLTATGATGGSTGDPDFDGRDNAYEYAFGLNPTSGADPTAVPSAVNRSNGKFTFTRRLATLTDLDYKVFTSGTLDSWQEDTTANLSVIGTAGQVETVEVTLSAPKPLAATRLFVRIVAE